MNSLRCNSKARRDILVAVMAVFMTAACGCGHKTQLQPPEPRRIETVIAPTARMACDRIILEWAPVMFDTKGDPLTEPASYLVLRKRGGLIKWDTTENNTLPAQTPLPKQSPLPGNSALPAQSPLPANSALPEQSPLPGNSALPAQSPLPADASEPDTRTPTPLKNPGWEVLPTEYDFSLVAIVPGPMVTPAVPAAESIKVSWEDTGVAPGPPFPANLVRFRIPAGFPPKPDPEAEGLVSGYSYTYAVVARDARGVTSPMSKLVEVAWIRIPAAPANFSAVTEPGKVTIQWTEPVKNCIGDPLDRLDGYEIQRASGDSPDKFVKVKTVKPAGQLTAEDDTVAPDQLYSYRIRGFIEPSIPGEFSASIAVDTADRFPPAPPAQLSGAVQSSSVHLNWRPVSDPDLAGYRVYRKSGEDRDFVILNPGSLIRTNTFVDNTVLKGLSYSYRITSVDGSTAANESKPCEIWAATIR